jgi:acetyltransferase
MSIRNLHLALRPRSVAIVGDVATPGGRGAAVAANLAAGGFAGPVHAVDAPADLAGLPAAPDLAAVVAPPAQVPDAVAALGAAGCRVAAILTPGLDAAQLRAALDAARPHLLRLIGPDAFGLAIPGAKLDLGLGRRPARPGRLALVSRSATIAATLVDWADDHGVGLSHVIGLGAMADVDLGDCLDLLAGEGAARAILVCAERIGPARKFLSAARAAARLKPVIVLKPGRGDAAAEAAFDAALRRAGALRVAGLAELFAAAETVGRFRPVARARLAVLTNGHGAASLALDRLADGAAELAALADGPNPLDLGADAGPDRFAAALAAAAADPAVDVTLTLACPTGMTDAVAIADAVAALARDGMVDGKPALAVWPGGADARSARARLRAAGLASYDTPDAAAEAVGHLTEWSRAQAALLRVPDRRAEAAVSGTPPDARAAAGAVLRAAAAEGRAALLPPEALAVVAAYGVPTAPMRLAPSPVEAGDLAADMLRDGGPLALKLVSRDLARKSDAGGVALDLATPQAVEEAALAMAGRLRAAAPAARLDGFALQPMVRRRDAWELALAVTPDPTFGPVIRFGAGGLAAEVLGDAAVGLPPLDAGLAADLVARTRAARLLGGFRGRPPADLDAVHRVLVALSHMAEDLPALRVAELDPVLADADGVLALDARVAFEPGEVDLAPPNPHLAIRPYPAAWRREAPLSDGTYVIRPILPLDVLLYPDFFAKLDPEDVRLRFMAPRRHFPEEMWLRLTQLDYDRDMAFVALTPAGALAGVARFAAEPDRAAAEYALVVRSDLAGRGLGTALMGALIDYARVEGVGRLEGMVLAENRGMRALIARLGFTTGPMPEEPGVVMSRLDL